MAFDYYTVSTALENQFDWKKFAQLEDIPSLTVFTSIVVASAGVATTSALSGEFKSIFAQVIEIAVKQIPELVFR